MAARASPCLALVVVAAVAVAVAGESTAIELDLDLVVDCPERFVAGFEAACGQLLVATDLLALTPASNPDCGRVVQAADDCTEFIVQSWETLSETEQEFCDPVTEAYLTALDEASMACGPGTGYQQAGYDAGDPAAAERRRRTGSGSGSGSGRRDGWEVGSSGSGRNAALTLASTTLAPTASPSSAPTASPSSAPTVSPTPAPTRSPTRTARKPPMGMGSKKRCGVGFRRSNKRPVAGMKIMYLVPVPHKPACADRCDHNELAGCTGFKTSRNRTDNTLICQLFTGAVETKCKRGKKRHQACCIRDPRWVTKAPRVKPPLVKPGDDKSEDDPAERSESGSKSAGMGKKGPGGKGPGGKKGSGSDTLNSESGSEKGAKTGKMSGGLDVRASVVADTSGHVFVALGLVFGMAAFGLAARRYKTQNRSAYTMVPSYNGRPTSAVQLGDGVIDGSVLQSLMADDQTDRKYLSFI